MHDYLVGCLVDGDHPGAEVYPVGERREEGPREPVHTPFDLEHVRVEAACLFPQQFQERGIHQRFLVPEQAEELHGFLGPLVQLQEFTHGILVVPTGELGPDGLAIFLESADDRLKAGRPQLGHGAIGVLVAKAEVEASGVGVGLPDAHPLPLQVVIGAGIVHRKRRHRQPELLHIRQRQRVTPGDAHGAGFGVEPWGKRIAKGLDAAADAVLGLED